VRVVKLMLVVLLVAVSWPAMSAPPAGLGEIRGQLIWVDFWASWCAPCRRSFPWMNTMHRKYSSQGLQIIAVNLDAERAAADAFLRETPANFALKFDPVGELAREFDVKAMPSSYLMDASGNILERHLGFKLADAAEYEAAIKAALAAHPAGTKPE
jgi:cytochrome c biogenesis protein CcmG/thiol:disulfide interchange protein DsbE